MSQDAAVCYAILTFGLDGIAKFLKCDRPRALPESLTEMQRRDVRERCVGLPKQKMEDLEGLLDCRPHLFDAVGWDNGIIVVYKYSISV